jgi:2-C-methyl-D-erythritol 4-phosphate cytidylyltransferase
MKHMYRVAGAMVALLAAPLAAIGPAAAASVINMDAEQRTIVVTEGSSRTEIVLGAGETVEICPTACFVTMPDGDRAALTGSEIIEISNGKGNIR